jgi:hypothetical protein
MPIVNESMLPILYFTWAQWRFEQITQGTRPLVELGSCFCFTCAGNGHIFERAGNGEGLIPAPCISCLGRGTV